MRELNKIYIFLFSFKYFFDSLEKLKMMFWQFWTI